jgi:hypothetical protein
MAGSEGGSVSKLEQVLVIVVTSCVMILTWSLVHADTFTVNCQGTLTITGNVATCVPTGTNPPQVCPPGTTGTWPNCVPIPPPVSDLSNCANQGMGVVGEAAIVSSWTSGGNWLTQAFGDHVAWVFQVTAPAGTAQSQILGRFAVSEYQGPPTMRQVSLSRTPCDYRAKDYTGANGPLSISNGTTATIIYGVCTPQFFGGTACLTPGVTYFVSARNWSVDFNNWSCGQASCNAVMNAQPATP